MNVQLYTLLIAARRSFELTLTVEKVWTEPADSRSRSLYPFPYDSSVNLQQGLGGLLISRIEGDFWNCVGFPAASFFTLLDHLVEEDDEFLEI